MKIHLTKKEYRLLLDYLAIGQWVMHAYDTTTSEQGSEHDQLEEKLLSYAKDFGYGNLVEYDSRAKKHYPTQAYELEVDEAGFVEEYDEEVFWNELCNRLAARDLLREKGREALDEMDFAERLAQEDRISEKYSEEFVTNGLHNLVIAKP